MFSREFLSSQFGDENERRWDGTHNLKMMEEKVGLSSTEKIRALHDYLALGPARPRFELQSKLMATAIFPSVANHDSLLEVAACQASSSSSSSSSPSFSSYSLDLSDGDEDVIVNRILFEGRENKRRRRNGANIDQSQRRDMWSLEEGLRFASDLQALRKKSPSEIKKASLSIVDSADVAAGSVSQVEVRGHAQSAIGRSSFSESSPETNLSALLNPYQIKRNLGDSNSGSGSRSNNDMDPHSSARGNGRLVSVAQDRRQGQGLGQGQAGMKRNYGNNRNSRAPEIPPPPEKPSNENQSKKNPFKTGRDQFLAEGGSFPQANQNEDSSANKISRRVFGGGGNNSHPSSSSGRGAKEENDLPPELAHLDKALVEKVQGDILHKEHNKVKFSDISGLEFAKRNVMEIIVWPIRRPELFTGLRALPKGLLLFGPPGTGKTLIGKAIAHESGATFFSISASTLTSKWIGEGEMAVRTLFAVASYYQPSVVFMDEVDSMLCQRSSDENEASRRLKTEFLIQLDGAGTDQSARVVVIGATNRPDELDEAARRRFVKRIYVPLPDHIGRRELLLKLLVDQVHSLRDEDVETLVKSTDGYSGADVRSLCTEAAMGPCRELFDRGGLAGIQASDMPPISFAHFQAALETVAPSVSAADLQKYVEWNSVFGTYRKME